MSNFGKQSVQFGLARESVRGTAEAAPTKWYPTQGEPDIEYGLALLEDGGLRGSRAAFAPVAGRKSGKGKLKLVLDPQSIGEFLYSLMGTDTAVEESEVVIADTNHHLDFNIGAAELNAAVANGTYKIGTAHTEAGTLCKAIYDAIHAAEAVGTYTVSYSRTTRKFTITRSAGTFVIAWNTGTNKANSIAASIGFSDAADSTGGLTYTGATAIQYAMGHTFSLAASITPPSYTFFINFGISVKTYALAVVKRLKFTGPVDGLIGVDVEFLFKKEDDGSIGTPAFPTQRYLSFQHVTYKIAGSTNQDVKSWTLDLDNGAKALQTLSQSQDCQDIVAPDEFKVSGSMVIHFTSETERAKFLAATAVTLQMLIEGAVVAGTSKWTVDFPITLGYYKSYPLGWEDGILAAKVDFVGYHNGTSIILPKVINQDVAYAA